MPNILTDLVIRQSLRYGDRPAYAFRSPGSDKWLDHSWNEMRRDVDDVACALETLGLEPQQMINIFSANCPQILITDFACYRNRAIPVSIYSTSSPEQVRFIVNDSGAVILMTGDRRQYDIAREIAADCPTLRVIVSFDETLSLIHISEPTRPY